MVEFFEVLTEICPPSAFVNCSANGNPNPYPFVLWLPRKNRSKTCGKVCCEIVPSLMKLTVMFCFDGMMQIFTTEFFGLCFNELSSKIVHNSRVAV